MTSQKRLGLVGVGLLLLANCELSTADTVSSVSSTESTNVAGAGSSFTPALSADGRYIVFVSHANNLVTNDDLAPYLDVFVRDRVTSNTVLVSVNMTGVGGGNADANSPSISSNGQFVAFVSASSNLVNNDTNNAPDIFVRDLISGSTTLVSVDTNTHSSPKADDYNDPMRFLLSGNPIISADGRWVAFESRATSLVTLPDLNGLTDVFVRDLQSNTTYLVSVNAASTATGNGFSWSPNMTPNGRFIVFVSTCTNLVSGVSNSTGDIYVRDLQAGQTVWVSTNVPAYLTNNYGCFTPVLSADGSSVAFKAARLSDPATVLLIHHDLRTGVSTVLTRKAPAVSFFQIAYGETCGGSFGCPLLHEEASAASFPEISADGRFVASESLNDVYVWDLLNGSNMLVSVNASGSGPANQASHTPVMTPDGGRVAFLSAATDLTTDATNGISQVFVRDLASGTTRLVSANFDGFASNWDIDEAVPAISADGRSVAFESLGADLVANDLNQASDVFLRDLDSGTTQLVSERHPGLPANTAAALSTIFPQSLSADSAHVAYLTSTNSLAIYDFLGRTSLVVSAVGEHPSLSADGRLVAYETRVSSNAPRDIVVQDIRTGFTTLISRNRLGTGGGNGDSTSPLLSYDGRFVVFSSRASDLVDNDNNNTSDIFVRDRVLGTTLLVSMNLQGNGSGNGASSKPVLGADGRTVVFQSMASDLVPGDYNDRRDVFMLRLGGQDTDGDGMDDDWEMAYFGTLARNGTGDFDGDGMTDLQEFLAGTDPTNGGSILRVMTLSSPGSGGIRVIWSASPGKTYQVQYKDTLDGSGWNLLPGAITANGTTASYLDASSVVGNQRFYRVLLTP